MMKHSATLPAEFGASEDIAFARVGTAIDIRLTRPKALNALTHQMALALLAGLQQWRNDRSISHVIISAEPGDKRAFCAGGDIRDLFAGKLAGSPRHQFFRDEYRLNEAIGTFQKPFIALMDGMVMGGGAGLSMHGSHRIVTQHTRFAMPEVGIGLIPDVGGSYILPRLKNHFGYFLGLTGMPVGPEECLEAGLATHYCKAEDIADLRTALLNCSDLAVLLNTLRLKPRANILAENAAHINWSFSAISLVDLFHRLETKSETVAVFEQALKKMKAASPLSLCLAFEQLKRGAELSLRAGLTMEYQLVSRILHGQDLYEGIRAAIIDRSSPPKWQHASIQAIDSASIAAFFNPPPEGDLFFGTV